MSDKDKAMRQALKAMRLALKALRQVNGGMTETGWHLDYSAEIAALLAAIYAAREAQR